MCWLGRVCFVLSSSSVLLAKTSTSSVAWLAGCRHAAVQATSGRGREPWVFSFSAASQLWLPFHSEARRSRWSFSQFGGTAHFCLADHHQWWLRLLVHFLAEHVMRSFMHKRFLQCSRRLLLLALSQKQCKVNVRNPTSVQYMWRQQFILLTNTVHQSLNKHQAEINHIFINTSQPEERSTSPQLAVLEKYFVGSAEKDAVHQPA